jgi:Tfp pilus assembly protein PilN
MNKLLSALKSIKVPKTILLAAAGALIVIALIGFGAVRNVQATRAEEAVSAQAAANRKAQAAQVQATIDRLTAENKALSAKAQVGDQACAELRKLDANKAITLAVTVPAYCK